MVAMTWWQRHSGNDMGFASGTGAQLPQFWMCNASEALLFLEFAVLQTDSLISPQHAYMVLKALPITTLLTTIFTVDSDTTLLCAMPMLTYMVPMLTYVMPLLTYMMPTPTYVIQLCTCRC